MATPMVMIAAIARAARHGILVKGGLYLERLAKVDAYRVRQDGHPDRTECRKSSASSFMTPRSRKRIVLRYAAAADLRSAHPLAKAVVKAARERGLQIPDVQDFQTDSWAWRHRHRRCS